MLKLATALGVPEASLNAQFNLATMTFSFAADLDYTGPAKVITVAFNDTLGNLSDLRTLDAQGNPVAATLSVTPQLSGHTVFGITLAGSAAFEELVVTAPAGYEELNEALNPNEPTPGSAAQDRTPASSTPCERSRCQHNSSTCTSRLCPTPTCPTTPR